MKSAGFDAVAVAVVGLVVACVSPVHADYQDEVLADEPVAYWRLGDGDVFSGALDSSDSFLDGVYVGDPLLEEDGLLFDDPDTAVRFNGIDAEVQIPDSAQINTGGPWQARTIELWFQAEVIDTERRVLWEEGGTTRGAVLFVEEVDGDPTLFMSMWNRAQEFWDPVTVSIDIEPEETYHAVLVMDASENDIFGDFDGRITGYLNGEEFETAIGADQLYAHGDDGAIGGIHVNTWFPDGTNPGDGGNFIGVIDEVAIYNIALDDPDDDGDLGDSRVLDHYLAGSGPAVAGCPTGLTITVDGSNVRLAWTKGAETSVRVLRDGAEIAAAAPVDPPEYLDMNPPPGSLEYELQFTLPGENCSLTRSVDLCTSGLTATQGGGAIQLEWQNGLLYSGITIMRGDDVIAMIGGGETSYTDTNPPPGVWTYSVVPEGGDCGPTTIDVRIFESEYPTMVVADGADAYWRLDDTDDLALLAVNTGAAGAALDGIYTGTVVLENDSLLPAEPADPSILLEGIDGHVFIPDSDFTNTGGPFHAKTVELWFQAEVIDVEPRILFEQGGTTRGLNLYVQEVEGDPTLVMGAWNVAEEQWGPVTVSAVIEPETTYHAVMVFEASENDTFGDFDGRITGYLNGEEIDTMIGADQLYAHSNDTGIGAVVGGETKLADGTNQTSGGFFVGSIDDVSLYNILLDDPDGDKDLSDSLVMAHYLAGTEEGGGPEVVSLKPGDVNGDGSFNIADMVAQLGFLFGGGALPECYVVPGTQELNATGLDILDYNGDGSSNIADAVAGLGGLFGGGGPHVLGEGCAEIEGTCQSNCQ